jgi:endogenous inhibitor of DNA gyrase (YacG/DUF329 family)
MSEARPPRRRPPRKCPICGKPASEDAYPFCSKRCADIDLNRWFSGAYAIPAREDEDEDDDERQERNAGRDED